MSSENWRRFTMPWTPYLAGNNKPENNISDKPTFLYYIFWPCKTKGGNCKNFPQWTAIPLISA
jgi:hypothetical protein